MMEKKPNLPLQLIVALSVALGIYTVAMGVVWMI
jgi:hypothetical protein